jgi:CubicO group peptidase (beta-lactamase class C family)
MSSFRRDDDTNRTYLRRAFTLLLLLLGVALSAQAKNSAPELGRASEDADGADSHMVSALHQTLAAYHEAGHFDGAALVAHRGEVVYTHAFGMANHEWSLPNTPETRFRIGSITKTFTALIALMLVEDGELDLHEPIATYLPDYRRDTGELITLHHLLTHSSGLRGEIDAVPGGEIVPFARADINKLVQKYAMEDLEFEPGTRVRYSSTGVTLIGHLIETVTGQSFEDLLQARVLEPAGMSSSGLASDREVVAYFATGYHRTIRGPRRATPVRQLYYSSAGMYSTVRDLFAYDQALRDGRLLSPELITLMNTEHFEGQGYAWTLKELGENEGSLTRIANHHGSQPGFTGRIWRYLDEDTCIILLDNHESRVNFWSAICSSLASVLDGEEVSPPTVPKLRPYLELVASEGLEVAVSRYRADAEEGRPARVSEFDFHFEFQFHMMSGFLREALEISSFWTRVSPESSKGWAFHGDAMRAAERYDEAKASYSRALQLNADSEAAKSGLEILEAEPASSRRN